MRIVHVSIGAMPPVFNDGGGAIQRIVAETALEQSRQGHEVTVLSPAGVAGSTTIDGVELRYLRVRARPPRTHLEFQARCLAWLGRRPRSRRPNVVHVHREPELAAAMRPLSLPVALGYDNFYFRGGRGSRLFPLYRAALRAYDLLLPVSEYCAQASTGYWGLDGQKVHVVPNGVNVRQFRPDPVAAARERASLPDGPVLVYLGRVCRQKGVDTLLRAFELLPVPANLVIAGPIGDFGDRNGDEAGWRRVIATAGAIYVGRLPEARLAGLLSMADVFVMPTAELEMQGMAALEAQACGTPVVASDHGGLPETVPDACGDRFPPGDAGALARALASLLADDERRRACAEAALAHARSLSWTRVVARLTPLYESIGA